MKLFLSLLKIGILKTQHQQSNKMGKLINQPNRFQNEKFLSEQAAEKKLREYIKKNTVKLTPEELKNGVPVLKLRCIETYSDAPTNREFFTRNYVYHVIRFKMENKEITLYMQTNFPDLEAEIPMKIANKIFAGFGKENNNQIKVTH